MGIIINHIMKKCFYCALDKKNARVSSVYLICHGNGIAKVKSFIIFYKSIRLQFFLLSRGVLRAGEFRLNLIRLNSPVCFGG